MGTDEPTAGRVTGHPDGDGLSARVLGLAEDGVSGGEQLDIGAHAHEGHTPPGDDRWSFPDSKDTV
jgi:hypothetical protein